MVGNPFQGGVQAKRHGTKQMHEKEPRKNKAMNEDADVGIAMRHAKKCNISTLQGLIRNSRDTRPGHLLMNTESTHLHFTDFQDDQNNLEGLITSTLRFVLFAIPTYTATHQA
jgi:hypothetical protein